MYRSKIDHEKHTHEISHVKSTSSLLLFLDQPLKHIVLDSHSKVSVLVSNTHTRN